MSELAPLLPLALTLLASGVVAGLIAGLLGVGGGIVLVPVLDIALQRAGFPSEWSLHVAVATSLATIVPTSITSSRAHSRRDAIDFEIVRAWAPGMVLGGLAGSLLASIAPVAVLSTVFGVMAALVAVKMVLPLEHLRLRSQVPRGLSGNLIAGTIGTASSLMGIGGGTLSVPAMSLTGAPIHRAVGTAALFGLLLSVPGTIGYLLSGPDIALPYFTVGYVNLIALAIVAPISALIAPLGARLAHSIDRRRLSQVFGAFLLLVASRMLYRTFA